MMPSLIGNHHCKGDFTVAPFITYLHGNRADYHQGKQDIKGLIEALHLPAQSNMLPSTGPLWPGDMGHVLPA